MKPPTKTEREILDTILREMRHVASTRDQLMITIDTYAGLSGATVVFSNNPNCNTYAFDGAIRAQRKRSLR